MYRQKQRPMVALARIAVRFLRRELRFVLARVGSQRELGAPRTVETAQVLKLAQRLVLEPGRAGYLLPAPIVEMWSRL
jgi:hypothetical protein